MSLVSPTTPVLTPRGARLQRDPESTSDLASVLPSCLPSEPTSELASGLPPQPAAELLSEATSELAPRRPLRPPLLRPLRPAPLRPRPYQAPRRSQQQASRPPSGARSEPLSEARRRSGSPARLVEASSWQSGEERPCEPVAATPALPGATRGGHVARGLLALAALVALVGCEEAKASTHRLQAVVVARAGARGPLAGVTLSKAGRVLGRTNVEGRLEVGLEGERGERVRLEVRCPEGYRAQTPALDLVMDDLVSLDSAAPSTRRVLGAECAPLRRQVAVVVRAAGHARLPVLANGAVLATTDADGLAHLMLDVAPESTLRVVLDTSGAPALRPRSPERSFQIGSDDAVLVFDQELSAPRPRPAALRVQSPTAITHHVPVRIR